MVQGWTANIDNMLISVVGIVTYQSVAFLLDGAA